MALHQRIFQDNTLVLGVKGFERGRIKPNPKPYGQFSKPGSILGPQNSTARLGPNLENYTPMQASQGQGEGRLSPTSYGDEEDGLLPGPWRPPEAGIGFRRELLFYSLQ